MSRAYSTHEEKRTEYRVLLEKLERKRPLGRPLLRFYLGGRIVLKWISAR
jgi:hypothetical protein